jgi:hypothetical protein
MLAVPNIHPSVREDARRQPDHLTWASR